MQHHAHVARTAPPHMRAHHMAVPPPHSQTQSHMPPLNITHVPPPPTGQQQQQKPLQSSQQQNQPHHLTNGPAPGGGGGSAAVITGSTISAPSHHHTRLNQQALQQHQPQHPPSMHNSTQLQKLRQQHQHINNNNNNSSTNKNNYHHHQPQQYNSASNTHGNVLPAQTAQQQQQKQASQTSHHTSRHPSTHQHQHQHQQHPLHQQQPQQQQQPPPLQPQQQQQHPLAVSQMPPQQALGHLKHPQHVQQTPAAQQHPQQQQQIQTTLNPANNVVSGHSQPPSHTQHPQQQQPSALNYYTAGVAQSNNNNIHKSKYNPNVGGGGSNGAAGGGMQPKTILQNPNRILKARLHSSAAANNIEVTTIGPLVSKEETKKISKSSNNSNIGDGGGANNVISASETSINANVAAAVTESAVIPSSIRQDCTKNAQSTSQNDASINDANKENVTSGTQNAKISNEVSSSNATNNNNNILSNEDNTVPKNSKEKTPMCLVNELARFNKITHQYRLTSEKGPAHSKRFTVTLKLGDEEYSAEGFKIKKAQHLAAAEAIEKTKYKHPVPKVIRRNADGEGSSSRANITPTVELNALAMKLGQQTYYLLDPRQVASPDTMAPPPDAMMPPRYGVPPPPSHALPPPGMGSGHMMPQHAPPPPPPHVRMMDPPAYMRRNGHYAVPPAPPLHGHPTAGPGMRPRYGAPPQRVYMPKYGQQQRYPLMAPLHMAGGPHNGMAPPPPMPHNPHHPHHGSVAHRYGMPAALTRVTLVVGKQKFVGMGYTLQQAKHDAASRALQVLKAQAATQLNEALNNSLEESDSKSPISLVHEIGIQRSMTVHFKVLREEGPAHMKKFVTACVVGSIVTEGEGNGKKTSKKRAAEKMLEELKKLPPLTPTKSPVKRIKVKTPSKAAASADAASGGSGKSGGAGGERRKRGSGSIKEKTESDADAENPITQLIQLQQNRKEKEPVFELIAKNGNENSRRREFIIEVTAHGMVARGTGNSKKLAKRNAAQNLLIAMGESDSDTAGVNTASAPANIQTAAAKERYARAPATAIDGVTSHSEQPNTVLQPIAEVPPPAVATEAHLDLPLVSTPAGQVPGILILRHNKKKFVIVVIHECTLTKFLLTDAAKKKEYAPSASCIMAENNENNRASDLAIGAGVQAVQQPAVKSGAINVVKESEVGIALSANSPSAVVQPVAVPISSNAQKPVSSAASSATTTTIATASSSASKPAGVHMKDQLLYLAKLLGFEVNFSDYPKGNHSEFLTIVTLSSDPPQICHGVGSSAEESQNDAARNALKILSELGLNNAAK